MPKHTVWLTMCKAQRSVGVPGKLEGGSYEEVGVQTRVAEDPHTLP